MTDWTDNLEKLRLWMTKRSGKEATREEAIEAMENLTGFFTLLYELDQEHSMKEGKINS